MGSCCGGKESEDVVQNKALDKERFDCSKGPLSNRRCTDIVWVFLYLLHLVAFFAAVALGGFSGQPQKLYWPRDFRGDYCGSQTQWNNGSDMSSHQYLVYTMNTSETMELIAKQLVCSSVAEEALRSAGALSAAEWQDYLCACCKEPCGSCTAVLPVEDLANPSALTSVISGKMADLSFADRAADLLASGGQALHSFGRIFHGVCAQSCASPSYTGAEWRQYRYTPDPDVPWKKAWDRLLVDRRPQAQAISAVASQNFTFKALPTSLCPYPPLYCVPFPGMEFEQVLSTSFCSAKNLLGSGAAAAAKSAAGAMAGVSEALQAEEHVGRAKESLGSLLGNILSTLDVLATVSVLAIVISLVYLVLLRFFLFWAVWGALFLVFFALLIGGSAAHVRSQQCLGTNFFGTVEIYGAWISNTADQVVTSGSVSFGQEGLSADGSDYRGVQTKTRTGRTCQHWASQFPHNISVPAKWQSVNLTQNYCRNPNHAVSIWCYTTDPGTRWELCYPITVWPFGSQCPQGYVVQDDVGRKALEVFGYILFGLSLLWLIVIFCIRKQIRLAININIVAARFVYNHPQVVTVPLLQALLGIVYCFVWAVAASVILSEVKSGSTPAGYFATYAEAYGTEDTPGACTGMWPAGSVWKYAGDLYAASDPCSGVYGNTTGMTPRCWRCSQPRFTLDWRFAAAFFSLLWNNALLIAFGQCIVAGACATYFFLGPGQKVVTRSTYNCFRYHFGSLAFGGFIIALVQFIRYCLKYLEKQAQAQKNRTMQTILKVLQCCLYCFEKCLKFLTKHAYIQIAVWGTNFCTSAKNAFFLLARNCVRFGTLEVLGMVMEFIGFAVIMSSTAVCGFCVLDALHPEVDPIGPMIVYVIVGYVSAELFISVFSLAVDSMLQCFIAAEEMGCCPDNIPLELRRMLPDYKPMTE